MGQQQLLLIILGVIIVGIAVAVGITMFQDNAVDQNRSAVIADLTTLAAKAQRYLCEAGHARRRRKLFRRTDCGCNRTWNPGVYRVHKQCERDV